ERARAPRTSKPPAPPPPWRQKPYRRFPAADFSPCLAAISLWVQASQIRAHSSETSPSARFSPGDTSWSGDITITPSQLTHLGYLSDAVATASRPGNSCFIRPPLPLTDPMRAADPAACGPAAITSVAFRPLESRACAE